MTKPGHSLCIVHYALCIAVAVVSANAETTATATAAPIAVNVDGGPIRTLAPCDVGYSPRWGGVADAGAHVAILKVEHADTANAVTSVVANCAVDAGYGGTSAPTPRRRSRTFSLNARQPSRASSWAR